MTRRLFFFLGAPAMSASCWAARCTTAADPEALREYESYVARAQAAMSNGRESFPVTEKLMKRNLSDAALNQRLAPRNGTIVHWMGGVRIPAVTVADVRSVLEDYQQYDRIFRPMIYGCKVERVRESSEPAYDVVLGLQNSYRFAALFPQRYSFQVKARVSWSASNADGLPEAGAHLHSGEIRESDSGVPGRNDFLEPYRDHGIMWALNAWWRMRQRGPDVELEFETITLARSVQLFACKLSIVPVPKSVVAAAMDAMPADSVVTVLEGTKAECGRRTGARRR